MMILTKTISKENQKSPTFRHQRKQPVTFKTALDKPFQSLQLLLTSLVKPHCPTSQASFPIVQS